MLSEILSESIANSIRNLHDIIIQETESASLNTINYHC